MARSRSIPVELEEDKKISDSSDLLDITDLYTTSVEKEVHQLSLEESQPESEYVIQRTTLVNRLRRSEVVTGQEQKFVYGFESFIDFPWSYIQTKLTTQPTTTDPVVLTPSQFIASDETVADTTLKSDFYPKNSHLLKSCSLNNEDMYFDLAYLMTLVRTSGVSVNMCLSTLAGFTPDKKQQLVDKFIEEVVTYNDINDPNVSEYFESLNKKVSKRGLSTFSFNVLGTYPYENPTWLLATKRTNIFLCFLSCLAQALRQRNVSIENFHLGDVSFSATDDSRTDGEKHLKWIFEQLDKRLQFLKEQKQILTLLEIGLTMTNCLSIGHSKASDDMLPFFVQFCRRSITVVLKQLIDSPKIRRLLKTAGEHCIVFRDSNYSSGSEKGFIEQFQNKSQGLLTAPEVVDLTDIAKLRSTLEQTVLNNIDKFANTIPLRWVFLHSLLLSLEVTLIRRDKIVKKAIECDIGMNDTEVELFLDTFTSVGSLLYIPSLTDVVIVNIEQFTDCLDKLYSYSEEDHSSKASSFGFISEATINSLVEDMKLDVVMFKDIVERFRFALPINISQLQLTTRHSADFTIDPRSYYVPSMRTSKETNGPQCHSLYLYFNPPGNMQVWLLRHFLKLTNCFLHPYSHINASLIDIQCSTGHEVQVKMIDRGDLMELKLEDHTHPYTQQNIKEVCALVVKVCYDALEEVKTLLVDDFKYNFAFYCKESISFHYILNKRIFQCDKCNGDCHPLTMSLRKEWIGAVYYFIRLHIPFPHSYSKSTEIDPTNLHIAKPMKANIDLQNKCQELGYLKQPSSSSGIQVDYQNKDTKESSSLCTLLTDDKEMLKKVSDLENQVSTLRRDLQVSQQNQESLQQALDQSKKELQILLKQNETITKESLNLKEKLEECEFEANDCNQKILPLKAVNEYDSDKADTSMATVGKEVHLYSAHSEHELLLEECGLKLSFPEGLLSPAVTVYEVATQGLWGGDFKFPEGTQLISGVCYISISPGSGTTDQLIKPVTVQLMHCAHITDKSQTKYLSFVSAQSHQSPFKFESEGIFLPDTQYGTIHMNRSFSLYAIVTFDPDKGSSAFPLLFPTNSDGFGYNFEALLTREHVSSRKVISKLYVYPKHPYFKTCIQKFTMPITQEKIQNKTFLFKFASAEMDGILEVKNCLPTDDFLNNSWTVKLLTTTIKKSEVYNFVHNQSGSLPCVKIHAEADPTVNGFKDSIFLLIDGIETDDKDNLKIVIDIHVPSPNKTFSESELRASTLTKKNITLTEKLKKLKEENVNLKEELSKLKEQSNKNVVAINDVDVLEAKEFTIQGDDECLMNWEEYGIRIEVSKGSLSPTGTATVKASPLIGGNFVFPDNTIVVSAVYDVTVSKPLLKPLRIDIEHCVDITSKEVMKDLKFAFAPSVDSPDQFHILEEGEFTISSSKSGRYGTIYRSKFSKLCVVIHPDNEESNGEEEGTVNGEGVASNGGMTQGAPSEGVASSEGVAQGTSSEGVAPSEGVASSEGVAPSEGVASSEGVAPSEGVASNEGVASSDGIISNGGVGENINDTSSDDGKDQSNEEGNESVNEGVGEEDNQGLSKSNEDDPKNKAAPFVSKESPRRKDVDRKDDSESYYEEAEKAELVTGNSKSVLVNDTTHSSFITHPRHKSAVDAMKFAGLVFYEWSKQKATFTSAKSLSVLIKSMKREHKNAERGQDVYFEFLSEQKYIELNFCREKTMGWFFEPDLLPPRLDRDVIENYGTKENCMPPSCQITVRPERPDAAHELRKVVKLEGVVGEKSFVIEARKECYMQPDFGLDLGTGATGGKTIPKDRLSLSISEQSRDLAAAIDIKTVHKKIIDVLTNNHVALTGLPKLEMLSSLAAELHQARLIGKAIKESPSIDKIIEEFTASLIFIKTIEKVHEHCFKFLKAFNAVGGSYGKAASVLGEEWSEAVEKLGPGVTFKFELN